MKQADVEWKNDMLSQDALKDQIIFDFRDGLPRRQLTVNGQVPFMRYAFDTRGSMEKALDSVSFIQKTRKRPGWVSSRSLKVGYYLNRSIRKWELFLWGPDLDMQVYKECQSRFESHKGSCLTAMPPVRHSGTREVQFVVTEAEEIIQKDMKRVAGAHTLKRYSYHGNGAFVNAAKEALVEHGLATLTSSTRRSEFRERRMKQQLIDGGARLNELTLQKPADGGALKGKFTYMGVKKPASLKSGLENLWEHEKAHTHKSQS